MDELDIAKMVEELKGGEKLDIATLKTAKVRLGKIFQRQINEFEKATGAKITRLNFFPNAETDRNKVTFEIVL